MVPGVNSRPFLMNRGKYGLTIDANLQGMRSSTVIRTLLRRLSLWWRFKQLDRTYQPLIEKAIAFENREAMLKLEEQYWYQTACLIEERRNLNQAMYRVPQPKKPMRNPAENYHLN